MFSEEPELVFCGFCGAERDVYEMACGLCIPCVREAHNLWHIQHPDSSRLAQDKRRALGKFIEDVDRLVVFERDQGFCQICGLGVDPQNWHLDHKIPLSRGGEHSYETV